MPSSAPCHRRLPDVAAAPAKADLRKAEEDAWKISIAAVVVQVRGQLTLKEFAAKVGREPRQCARWMDATERPQFDAIFAVPAFRRPLLLGLASLAGADVDIETVVRIRTAGGQR